MRADLHIHSVYSGDAAQTPAQVLERAKAIGLGAVAIADHNSLEGSLESLELADGIIVLRAMEVTSSEGHILAYNVSKEIEKDLSPAETIKRIREAGGLAVAPHTYRIWSGLGEKVVRENEFDALEVLNGRSLMSANKRAMRLADSLHLPVTGGSDAHSLDEIGKACTVFPDDCLTANDLIESIVGGRTEIRGEGRFLGESFSYGTKCIGEWLGRGMKRL
ncbi:MAG TPA: PHP domain-containing protein [Methanomassiliicoccales archaeon]|nr:PHP domain-containing protein [Methanomassiliicoccales archaeon]